MQENGLNTAAEPSKESVESAGPEVFGPGALLRRERHSLGMSINQIAEITRVRENQIEAIEKENWEDLPAPVFVKGFLRAYARALGLAELKVIKLYNNAVRAQTQSAEPKQPLVEIEEKPRRVFLIALLLTIGILTGVVVHFRQGGEVYDERSTQADSTETVMERAVIPPAVTDDGIEMQLAAPFASASPESTEARPEDSSVPATEPEGASGLRPPSHEAQPSIVKPTPDDVQTPTAEAPALQFVVHERTWVSISIDGEKQREFLFQPGSRPAWKEGAEFNLLIGNAGGVTVVYRGNTLQSLGKTGQVVRLKLPQDLSSFFRGEQ